MIGSLSWDKSHAVDCNGFVSLRCAGCAKMWWAWWMYERPGCDFCQVGQPRIASVWVECAEYFHWNLLPFFHNLSNRKFSACASLPSDVAPALALQPIGITVSMCEKS